MGKKEMSDSKRKTLVILAAIMIFVIIPVLFFTIKKLTTSYDRITYKGSQYINTDVQVDTSDDSKEFTKQYKAALDGNTVIGGMSVYESKADKIQGKPPYLFLVDSDGIIWVYQLNTGS